MTDTQDRVLAIGRLNTAIKHMSNAEDRVYDAVFYTLGLRDRPENFSLDAERITHQLMVLQTEAIRLVQRLSSGVPESGEETP